MEVVPPTPLDDEEQPLLDDEHPDHGTLTRQEAYLEGRDADAENASQIVAEPSTLKLIASMGPLYLSAFFAAAGKPALTLPPA